MISGSNLAREIMKTVCARLAPEYGEREASSIVELIFEERFGINRVAVALNPEIRLTESQIVRISKDVNKLTEGMPVQYVLGYTSFLGLRIKVTPSVLIPRPETEELTLLTIERIRNIQNPAVLDICTGSGAIAIAVKSACPSARVSALDNSNDALSVAAQNAADCNTEITFFRHDILTDSLEMTEKQDCVVSNPPYIPDSERSQMPLNVRNFEPANALFVKNDNPLLFYQKIGEECLRNLREGGCVIVETHFLYAGQVAGVFRTFGFQNINVQRDINGKNRFVTAIKDRFKK